VIPHNQPTFGDAECQAAIRVLDSGWVAQGREVQALEDEVCRFLGLGSGHAVALSNGTTALFLALWALGARDKRIAIPVFSCAAVRNAVIMAGGFPVSIDVAYDSPNIDLEAAAASGADLIVAAHIFGTPSRWDMGRLAVPIIEDCAQAFGARIDGRAVGLNGTVGIFSFYATKMITTGGQGGMLVSADASLVDAVRDYRQFDCRRDRAPRFNFQMTDLQAAVGRAQLSRIDEFIDARRQTREHYVAAGLPLWHVACDTGIAACHYRAVLRSSDPTSLIAGFGASGVRAIVPIADWELLGDPMEFPRALSLARSTVSIPIHPSLTRDDIAQITRIGSLLQSTAN